MSRHGWVREYGIYSRLMPEHDVAAAIAYRNKFPINSTKNEKDPQTHQTRRITM